MCAFGHARHETPRIAISTRDSGDPEGILIRTRSTLVLIVALSVLIALPSYRFLSLGFLAAFADFHAHLDARWLIFVAHVCAAPLALLLGALQFVVTPRAMPKSHRWLGRGYVVAVMFGGISGLGLATNAIGGPIAGLGFGLLSILWMYFTAQGIRAARAYRFVEHRRWMIRSFSLTFAAVTLRIYLAACFAAGIDYASASVFLSWVSWAPNLLVAHWWLVRTPNPSQQTLSN